MREAIVRLPEIDTGMKTNSGCVCAFMNYEICMKRMAPKAERL